MQQVSRYQYDTTTTIIIDILNENVRQGSISPALADQFKRDLAQDRACQSEIVSIISEFAQRTGWRDGVYVDTNHLSQFIAPYLERMLTAASVRMNQMTSQYNPQQNYIRSTNSMYNTASGFDGYGGNRGTVTVNRDLYGAGYADDPKDGPSRSMFDHATAAPGPTRNPYHQVSEPHIPTQEQASFLTESPVNTFTDIDKMTIEQISWSDKIYAQDILAKEGVHGVAGEEHPVSLNSLSLNASFTSHFDAFRYVWKNLPNEAKMNYWGILVNYKKPLVINIGVDAFRRIRRLVHAKSEGALTFENVHEVLSGLPMGEYQILESAILRGINSRTKRYLRLKEDFTRKINDITLLKNISELKDPTVKLTLAKHPNFFKVLDTNIISPVLEEIFGTDANDAEEGVIGPDSDRRGDYILSDEVQYKPSSKIHVSKLDIAVGNKPDCDTMLAALTSRYSIVRTSASFGATNFLPEFDDSIAISSGTFAWKMFYVNEKFSEKFDDTSLFFHLKDNLPPSENLTFSLKRHTLDHHVIFEKQYGVIPGFI